MDALSITQTIFYAIASIVLIALGAILVAIALRLLGILKDARDMTKGIKFFYDRTKKVANKLFSSTKKR